MKKIFALFLVVFVVFSLIGCNSTSKSSDVSADKLIDAIKDFEYDASSNTTETDDGYVITIDCGNYMEVKVITDKQKQIISADFIQRNADTEYYKTLTPEKVSNDIANWENIPMGKVLCSLFAFRTATYLVPVLKGSSSSVYFILNTRLSTETTGKWAFRTTEDGSEIIITATYTN